MTFLDKILGVPGLTMRMTMILAGALAVYLFAGYVLVPHPDHLDQFYPALKETIMGYFEAKNRV